MSFDAWLARLDPAQLSVGVILVLGVGVFAWRKLWPWFAEYYIPQRARLEAERTEIFAVMRDTLIELKAIAGQQVALLHEQRTMLQHAAALLEGQRVILETLRREERETREALNHASGN